MRLKPNEDIVSVLFSVRLPYVCDAVVFLTQIQTLYTFMQTFQQHKQHPKSFPRMVRIKVISSLVSLISSSEQPGSEKRQLKLLQHHHTEPQAVLGQEVWGDRMDVFLHRSNTKFLMSSPALQQLDTSPGARFLDTCPCPGSWIRYLSRP